MRLAILICCYVVILTYLAVKSYSITYHHLMIYIFPPWQYARLLYYYNKPYIWHLLIIYFSISCLYVFTLPHICSVGTLCTDMRLFSYINLSFLQIIFPIFALTRFRSERSSICFIYTTYSLTWLMEWHSYMTFTFSCQGKC